MRERIVVDARTASLQRVMGAKAACQQPKPQFQVRY
jgi:hypothetical protein